MRSTLTFLDILKSEATIYWAPLCVTANLLEADVKEMRLNM